MQRSGGRTEGQQLQVKAGWLGFSASIATGISGCIIGRYVVAAYWCRFLRNY